MADYEAKGGCKRKLSDDINDATPSSSDAAPPRKKTKRIKQVSKASLESESNDDASDQENGAGADADAAEEEVDQQHAHSDEDSDDKPACKSVLRRAAATAAKKNISAAAKLSTSVFGERKDAKEENSKDEKKKRARKTNVTVDTAPASSYLGIKQDDLKDDEDLLHTEFVSISICTYRS